MFDGGCNDSTNLLLITGSGLILIELVPMVPDESKIDIKLEALEHKSKEPTVRSFTPKKKESTSLIKQKVHLPEHFASCAIEIIVKSTTSEEEHAYNVKIHIGEY